jgi:gliding motility-associated-like protein
VGTGNSITVSPTSTTTYFVRAENACGNTICDSVTINVHTTSTAPISINATDNPTCGGPTTLSVVGGTLGTGAQWIWYSGSCGGTLVGTGNSITVSPSSTTSYFVRAENACGNTSCASITITVNSSSIAPTSLNATNNPTCGGPTTLSIVGGTLGSGDTWTWYSGSCGGTLEGTGSSIIVNPSTTTTYFLRAEGACVSTSCISITINVDTLSTAPTQIIASATSLCEGNSVVLTVSGGSLGTGAQWEWFDDTCGGNLIGTGNSINVSPLSSTTYFVRASGNCNTTSCVSVTINVDQQTTIADAGLDEVVCGSSLVLNANIPIIGNGVWSQLSGPGILNFNSINQHNSSVNASSFGVYEAIWTITNGVCISSDTITIQFDEIPTIGSLISPQEFCGLTGALTGTNPNVGIGTWNQISGPGTLNFGNINSANSNVSSTVSGLYTIEWNVINGSCSVSDTIDIEFYNIPTPVNAGSDSSICGLSTNLNALVPNIGNGVWSQISGSSNSVFGSLNSPNTSFSSIDYGTYTLVWTVTNGACILSDTISVSFEENPAQATIITNDTTICTRNIQISALAPSAGIGYWSIISGNATISDSLSNTTIISNLSVGNNTFIWTISNGSCPPSFDTLTINVNTSSIIADFSSDSIIYAFQVISFNDLSIGNPFTWHWNFGDGDSSLVQNPGHIYTNIGTYPVTLTITNSEGCVDTITKYIDVIEKLIIPNVFTPNNDGINDVYKIIASGYSNFNMKILNRWGEILFESEDINYGWDGRSVSGSLISEGTYFYIIKLTTPRGDNIIETGPLQLLR